MNYILRKPDKTERTLTRDELALGYSKQEIDPRWLAKPAEGGEWVSVGAIQGLNSAAATTSPVTVPTPPPPAAVPGIMFCRNCGKQVSEMAIACPACGVPPRTQKNFCLHCGKPTSAVQVICTQCGVSLEPPTAKGKIAAGILGLFLGGFGAHKFYLGYTAQGVFLLCVSLLSFFLAIVFTEAFIVVYSFVAITGFVEGIIYLTKSDQEFARTYIQNKHEWF